MVAISRANLISGALEILDAKRDIRSNVYQANSTFMISAFSGNAEQIINYPEQTRGYVYSADGSVTTINYSTEAGAGATGASSGVVSSYFVPADAYSLMTTSESTGTFTMATPSAATATTSSLTTTYSFPIPNVYKVVSNPSHTVVLLFLRNSDMVYRLLFLNSDQVSPPNALTCQPLNKPIYCIVPVGATQSNGTVSEPSFHRPFDAYFSPDGTQVYIMSCGAECGGTAANGDAAAAVNFANLNMLRYDYYPGSTYVSPIAKSVPVPGGATTAISDGVTVYVAGQSLQTDGLFGGNLSLIPLSTMAVSQTMSIADGTHTKMLFADNNTLWIGAQNCASGERAAHNQNYNCLTRFSLTSNTAGIVPAAVVPGTASTVPYPNENLDQYYYGSLTGLCYVESLGKVYTAYGGQIHAFNTVDGSEINNQFITVQGTAMDVSYMDASTNEVN
jgi:hypothetical protein